MTKWRTTALTEIGNAGEVIASLEENEMSPGFAELCLRPREALVYAMQGRVSNAGESQCWRDEGRLGPRREGGCQGEDGKEVELMRRCRASAPFNRHLTKRTDNRHKRRRRKRDRVRGI